MANGWIFNSALAMNGAYYDNVQTQTPSTSRLGIAALADTGCEAGSVLITKTTLAGVFAGTTNEAVNTGYERIILTHSDLPARAPDQVNNWLILNTLANKTWSSVVTGDGIAKLVIYYIPVSGSSADSACIPLTLHDFPITPNGNDITIDFQGFFKASQVVV